MTPRLLAVLASLAAAPVASDTLVHVGVGTIGWYFLGYAFAYGGPHSDDGILEDGFIGADQFDAKGFLESDEDGNLMWVDGTNHLLAWFFQWAFCTAAATIVSGAVTDRVLRYTRAVYAVVMSSFIYPVVVALTCGYGWLASAPDVGCFDFAGNSISHLRGGVSGLAGTTVFGPRKGRSERADGFEPRNLPLVVLGTLALWFGWFGFNCGSTLDIPSVERGTMAAQANTTIAAAATSVSGAVAECVLSYVCVAHASVMSAFIHPVVVALTWGHRWLAGAPDVGCIGFAGTGIAYLRGEVSGLAGTAESIIVSGAVAERVLSYTQAAHASSCLSSSTPWPLPCLGSTGGSRSLPEVGCLDSAGSGTAPLCGRVSGLAGTTVLGPRKWRFERSEDIEPHNLPLVALGPLALRFGWYDFNRGSTLGISSVEKGAMASQRQHRALLIGTSSNEAGKSHEVEDRKARTILPYKLTKECEVMCKEVGVYSKCTCPDFAQPDSTPGVRSGDTTRTMPKQHRVLLIGTSSSEAGQSCDVEDWKTCATH